MTETTELAKASTEIASLIDTSMAAASDLQAAVTSAKYLPRVQLMTGRSKIVQKKEFTENHFALVISNSYQDLGASVDALVVGVRPKAVDTKADPISVSYDPRPDANNQPTGEFARIKKATETPDSGCMYGLEFLLWLPETQMFATLFLGSASGRMESQVFLTKMGKAITLKAQFIETKRYSWWAVKCFACSTPFNLPTTAAIQDVLARFKSPDTAEEAALATEDDQAR